MRRIHALVAALALGGCGSDDSSTTCTSVAGTWQYVSHCDSVYVGLTINVTQNQCNISTVDPVSSEVVQGGLNGRSISVRVGTSTCSGQAGQDAITMTCDGTCGITLQRVTG